MKPPHVVPLAPAEPPAFGFPPGLLPPGLLPPGPEPAVFGLPPEGAPAVFGEPAVGEPPGAAAARLRPDRSATDVGIDVAKIPKAMSFMDVLSLFLSDRGAPNPSRKARGS